MNQIERQVTSLDHIRLFNMIRAPRGAAVSTSTAEQIKDMLDYADIVDPRQVPSALVTMRSRVRLVQAGGRELEATLAYPDEASAGDGRISVFSPLGLSLLGARAEEVIEWTGPDGDAHQAKVAAILYQPEAAGDFNR